jgi:hypothetical protein
MTEARRAAILRIAGDLRNTFFPGDNPGETPEIVAERDEDGEIIVYRLFVAADCTIARVPARDCENESLLPVAEAIAGAGQAILDLFAENAALRADLAAIRGYADQCEAARCGRNL